MIRIHRAMALTATMASLTCLVLAGCHVTQNDDGGKKNVSIGTPFGSLKVHTDSTTNTSAIGIAPYPGAIPITDSGDDNGNAANVNMNFGSFHLGVKTAFFQTTDAEDKVLAFYRKDLAQHFGDVVECRGDKPVGSVDKTAGGLTCGGTRNHHYVQFGSELDGKHLELLSGSEQHQHIVTLKDHDGGIKIGLVALDLPSHSPGHDGKDSE
jgi:hypothetical protein